MLSLQISREAYGQDLPPCHCCGLSTWSTAWLTCSCLLLWGRLLCTGPRVVRGSVGAKQSSVYILGKQAWHWCWSRPTFRADEDAIWARPYFTGMTSDVVVYCFDLQSSRGSTEHSINKDKLHSFLECSAAASKTGLKTFNLAYSG